MRRKMIKNLNSRKINYFQLPKKVLADASQFGKLKSLM
jgi:hypothetical protein